MRWWRLLVKWIGHYVLRTRRYSPAPFARSPGPYDGTEAGGDTGGSTWYRPTHRKQDPSADPREPGGGESSGAGSDHGWANCTMTSGAMALDFHTQGRVKAWGGDLRHRQGDQDGGTDLYDLRDAWASYGETLTIRSGKGWTALTEDRAAGRFLVVQGEGNVPGSATFDGGHACVVGPESDSGGRWLFGDPLAGGWQWIERGAIQGWMENWGGSGLAWARTDAHPPSTPPPTPEPVPPTPPPAVPRGYTLAEAEAMTASALVSQEDAQVGAWVTWLSVGPPEVSDLWESGAWDVAGWAREPTPSPLSEALKVQARVAVWGGDAWREAGWIGTDGS